jgi:signal peptidase I
MPSRPPILSAVKEWIRLALLTVILFLLVRGMVLEAFTIPTGSMEGTLLVGDYVLVNKAVYGARIPLTDARLPAVREPARGDVIVFRPPHDPGRNYVKRVVGVEGDTLEMREKTLFLNGTPLTEGYAHYLDRRGDAMHPDMAWQSDFLAAAGPGGGYAPSRDNWGPLVVPLGELFVLGDNRDNSEDSRYWGFVPRKNVTGSPWLVYLSLGAEEDPEDGWWRRVRWGRTGARVR